MDETHVKKASGLALLDAEFAESPWRPERGGVYPPWRGSEGSGRTPPDLTLKRPRQASASARANSLSLQDIRRYQKYTKNTSCQHHTNTVYWYPYGIRSRDRLDAGRGRDPRRPPRRQLRSGRPQPGPRHVRNGPPDLVRLTCCAGGPGRPDRPARRGSRLPIRAPPQHRARRPLPRLSGRDERRPAPSRRPRHPPRPRRTPTRPGHPPSTPPASSVPASPSRPRPSGRRALGVHQLRGRPPRRAQHNGSTRASSSQRARRIHHDLTHLARAHPHPLLFASFATFAFRRRLLSALRELRGEPLLPLTGSSQSP